MSDTHNRIDVRFWQDRIAVRVPSWLEDDLKVLIPDATGHQYKKDTGEVVKYFLMKPSPVVAYLIHSKLSLNMDIENSFCPVTMGWVHLFKQCLEIKDGDAPVPLIPGLNEINHETGEPLVPWPHQVRAFWWAKDLPGLLLGFDMGTGKSLATVAIISNCENKRVLILCPKSVVSVWPSQLCYSKTKFNVCVPSGNKSVGYRTKEIELQMKVSQVSKAPLVVITNYDSFWREPCKGLLLKEPWDVIVMDESHRVKSPNGVASKAVWSLCKKAKKRIALTGTPLPHSLLDGFSQFRAIDSSLFGSVYHKHKMRYAVMGGYLGKEVKGFQNTREFSERFHLLTFQAKKSLLKLPPFIHSYRTCTLKPETWKVYKELDKELFAEIEAGTITPANAMVKVLRLQQLTGGYLKLDDGTLHQYGTEKKDLLADLLADIPKDAPVVVVARFTADIANIKEAMKDAGRTCGELSGRANDLERWKHEEFNSLAVQIRSGGVGVSMVRASFCIYYSVGHSLGDYLQSLDRTHRYGQTETVRYYHLLADGTVDQKVYRALMERKDVIETIMEKRGREVSDNEFMQVQAVNDAIGIADIL